MSAMPQTGLFVASCKNSVPFGQSIYLLVYAVDEGQVDGILVEDQHALMVGLLYCGDFWRNFRKTMCAYTLPGTINATA